MIVNKQELAEIIGKSERTITTWQKQGMPIALDGTRGTENKYNTVDVFEWMLNREIERRISEHGGTESDFYDYEIERGRLTHHQANKTELEAAKLRGSLVEKETLDKLVADMAATIRANALAIPTKGAHLFLNLEDLEEAQANLKSLVYELLNELTTYEPSGDFYEYNSTVSSDDSTPA